MTAKELLLRYLRQRTELGESELVLDGMGASALVELLGRVDAPEIPAAPAALLPPSSRAVHTPSAPLPIAAGSDSGWTELREAALGCVRCRLCESRTQVVFGEGSQNAELIVVGEAPGADEDRTGRPFVGRAGQLLDLLLASVGFPRESVYICNVLKCRPPANRNPQPDEIAACAPYLRQQLDLVAPRAILAVGTFAAQTLLESTTPIGRLRAESHRLRDLPLIATYHPAALLRNPSWIRPVWEDLQRLRTIVDAG